MTTYDDRAEPVRAGHALDTEALGRWLEAHPIDGETLRGPVEVLQFPRGYSNLTYLLRAAGRELVLRRPPAGVAIASAHDMGREHRILSTLRGVWPRVPRTLAYEPDAGPLGAPFYLMERVEGVILRARVPAGLALGEARMRHLSEAMIDTLAEIHGVDLEAAGLTALGRPEGYAERQVRGWIERYQKAKTDDVPAFDRLAAWLSARVPASAPGALVHNDFKYDNVVLSSDLETVRAVLDWEMATVGDPWMDLGCALGYWIQSNDAPALQAMRFGPTELPGSLTRTELVARYEARTGRAVPHLPFYMAFALMKLAVVAQQLYQRVARGLTSEPRYAMMIEAVKGLSRAGVRIAESGRIDVIDLE